jgi:fructose-1,6-bisphosphatase
MVTEVSSDINGVLVPIFDVLFQDFMEKKENLVFMRDPLDGSNKQLSNVHFVVVLSIFEGKKCDTIAALILSRCVYTI